jgi:hypothetical protein
MYPTSQVALPIFSGLWNLELLGQIHRSDFSVPAPIPVAWQTQRDSDFRDAQRLLTSGFAFDDDVSAKVTEGWGTGSGWPEDERELDLYISVCGGGRPAQAPARDVESRKVLVDWVARRLFAMLLEAALLAKWMGEREGRSVRDTAVSDLLVLAARIAGPATPFEVATPREAAKEWLREEPWSSGDLAPEWRTRLRAAMGDLAAAE